jgi:signal transduction histidine kinase
MPEKAIGAGAAVDTERASPQAMRVDPSEEMRLGRPHLLAQAVRLLAASVEHKQTLSAMAALAARTFGEFALVEVEAPGSESVLTLAGPSNDDAPLAQAVEDRLRKRRFPALSRQLDNIPSPLVVEVTDPALIELVSPLRPRSMLIVPLAIGDGRRGVLAFLSSRETSPYGAIDLEIAVDLGRCVARAIENAELLHKAEISVQAREQLIDVVAHDLNNSLSAAKLSLAALSMQPRKAAKRSRRYAPILRRALEHMERLVSDLRDARQMELGRFTVRADAAVAPDVLIRCALEAASGQARLHQLQAASTPQLGLVPVDKERVLQVFANLIANALKFTPPGGIVTVGARAAGNDDVTFFVRDTGPGIPEADQAHVFEWRWQARPDEGRGSGLGLAICRGIVEAHGGTIAVESQPGLGSTFSFTLPAASHPGERGDRAAPGRTRILVVEEDPLLRDNLCEIVSLAGHEPIGVQSAEEALAEIARMPADLVVVDQRLPDMTGAGLLETLHSRGSRIPAIILTGFIDDEAARAAERLGIARLAAKPSDIAALLASLFPER